MDFVTEADGSNLTSDRIADFSVITNGLGAGFEDGPGGVDLIIPNVDGAELEGVCGVGVPRNGVTDDGCFFWFKEAVERGGEDMEIPSLAGTHGEWTFDGNTLRKALVGGYGCDAVGETVVAQIEIMVRIGYEGNGVAGVARNLLRDGVESGHSG